jgi:hypothetical protein
MSHAEERRQTLQRLDVIERGLKTLLSALESKRAPADSIDRAMAALEALPFDAEAVVRTFDGASRTEVAYVSSRLKYLADLEAIARTECQNILATTTVAIERAQVLKARLATLAADDDTGESVDCVR